MALSLEGWIDGLTATTILFSALLLGLFFIYKSIKTKAKLLFYAGFAITFFYIPFMGVVVDFIVILFTGKNFVYATEVTIIFYPMIVIALIFYVYICAELLFPDKKGQIVLLYLILSSLWFIAIIIDPLASIIIIYPENSGENVINYHLNLYSLAGIIFVICVIMTIIFSVIILIKGLQLKGILRKKFLLLSLFFSLYWIFAPIEAITELGPYIILNRIGLLSSIFIWYLVMREEPEKTQIVKKEVKVEKGLFRLSEITPGEISEEEVTFYRDQLICLVCKGRATQITFICDKCNALYCFKCMESLTNLENACWVCDTPFDESKPSKPYKEEAMEEIEISEKPQKKRKIKK